MSGAVNSLLGRRRLVLVLCLAVAGGVGLVSVRHVTSQLAVMNACEAAATEDWNAALAGTESRSGDVDTLRASAECRCMALLATERGDECVELLEAAVAEGQDDGWAPQPALSIHLIQTWRERARTHEAAELAERAARRHPDDPDLFFLELETRSSIGDTAVLPELRARIPDVGPQAVRMQASLANHYLFRGDPVSALDVLGDAPPARAGAAAGLWFDTRGMTLAANDDIEGVIANREDWRRAGGDPVEIAARYALTLSIAGLADPEERPATLLRRALARADELHDPKLHETLAIRLILTLANEGNTDEALAVYDRGRSQFEMAGLSRAELMRSAVHRKLAELPRSARRGSVRFAVAAREPGDVLLLSPEPEIPVDSSFTALPIPESGRLEVDRAIGTAPLRWVYRDAGGRNRGSGSVQLAAGANRDVAVARRPPLAPQHLEATRLPGDGRRRVFVLLLDCGDWRLVEYLRARGELPMLSALLRDGHRAVLDSDPPLTAAALEAMVWPNRRGADSFVALVHRFGVELAGLASVGENPFAALHWLMPEGADLFSVLGAGKLTAANLLLAHGSVRAGRHSEVTGPDGVKRRIPLTSSARDLRADERERWPSLAAAAPGRDRLHIRTIAAEFDTVTEIVGAGEVDFLAMRIEPLDILTHGHFAATVRDGQDDGDSLLYEVYRYIDARIAEVHERVDADDVFIVMSDHGIRTAMEHSRHGMFVATGPGIPKGRAAGRPALRGVSAVFAELLGVETDWPDTGVAAWTHALAATETTVATGRPKPDAPEVRASR